MHQHLNPLHKSTTSFTLMLVAIKMFHNLKLELFYQHFTSSQVRTILSVFQSFHLPSSWNYFISISIISPPLKFKTLVKYQSYLGKK